jgi:RHS repeat-associated protein
MSAACWTPPVATNQTASYFCQPGGDRPVTRTDAAGTVWYLQDLAGSVSALARNDGTLYGRYHYSPWGKVVSTDAGMPAQPLLWTARELDGTGLYYLRSRYYLASTGRFLSEDALGLAAGRNPGNLTPRPGKDDDGLSFDLNPFDGEQVVTTAGEARGSGFIVNNDHDSHVNVSVPDMDDWIGKRDSPWTDRLRDIVRKFKP